MPQTRAVLVTFVDGASLNPNITITYTGLKIKGGSGNDFIENDAKNGIVTDGNGIDHVFLGGAGAKAILGTGTGDRVASGLAPWGPMRQPVAALGDSVTFGHAATADTLCRHGRGSRIDRWHHEHWPNQGPKRGGRYEDRLPGITTSSNIFDAIVLLGATNITTAENAAVAALGGPGVVFFNFGGNEYFIATNHAETAVSSTDAIVKLVGVHDLVAGSASGLVTLV